LYVSNCRVPRQWHRRSTYSDVPCNHSKCGQANESSSRFFTKNRDEIN